MIIIVITIEDGRLVLNHLFLEKIPHEQRNETNLKILKGL